MPTKTKTDPAAQQAKLDEDYRAARQEARDARARIEAHKAEVDVLRAEATALFHAYPDDHMSGGKPLPGTPAHELLLRIRQAEANNPHTGEHEAAVERRNAAELAASRHRVATAPIRADEITDRARESCDLLRSALQGVRSAVDRYQGDADDLFELLEPIDGLTGQDVALDQAVGEIRRLLDALEDHEFQPPRSFCLQPLPGEVPRSHPSDCGTTYVRH